MMVNGTKAEGTTVRLMDGLRHRHWEYLWVYVYLYEYSCVSRPVDRAGWSHRETRVNG